MTSGSSSVPGLSLLLKGGEQWGVFAPTAVSTWACRVSCRQCLSPRVPGQGPRGETGFWKLDMSVCQRIGEDGGARRAGSLRLSNCRILWAQHPAAAALPASPRPQRHLVGSAGRAFPPRRGSRTEAAATYRTDRVRLAVSLRLAQNRVSSHGNRGNNLLAGLTQLLPPPMPHLHTNF